eukprot:TRINITY_DN17085_c0_g1_i1.p1 TRINITY_DN17085_c0_g1~~TRINITY_DN17085_c0_g1_i1.p1  ORF type:complete len:347 (-),score=23.08 TRINITY_DN17085_c0_g1_i1:102-1142(-)
MSPDRVGSSHSQSSAAAPSADGGQTDDALSRPHSGDFAEPPRNYSSSGRRPPRPPHDTNFESSRRSGFQGSSRLGASGRLDSSLRRPRSGDGDGSPPMMQRRARPMAISHSRSSHEADSDGDDACASPKTRPFRPKTHTSAFRPMLNLSGSLGSLRSTLHNTMGFTAPDTPGPDRASFKRVDGGIRVILFDFDGTLTATPGDQAVRSSKMSELCERASMLRAGLTSLREAGATMGIISKSTEATIQDALVAAGLQEFFTAPVLGKAVGFEGKAGFIDEMLQTGQLPLPVSTALSEAYRILLVDDDVLELDRARARGYQCYAAPLVGGLSEDDFDTILQGVRTQGRS